MSLEAIDPICGQCGRKLQSKRLNVDGLCCDCRHKVRRSVRGRAVCRRCGGYIQAQSISAGGTCWRCRRADYSGVNPNTPQHILDRIELLMDRASRGEPLFMAGYRDRAVEQGWVEC